MLQASKFNRIEAPRFGLAGPTSTPNADASTRVGGRVTPRNLLAVGRGRKVPKSLAVTSTMAVNLHSMETANKGRNYSTGIDGWSYDLGEEWWRFNVSQRTLGIRMEETAYRFETCFKSEHKCMSAFSRYPVFPNRPWAKEVERHEMELVEWIGGLSRLEMEAVGKKAIGGLQEALLARACKAAFEQGKRYRVFAASKPTLKMIEEEHPKSGALEARKCVISVAFKIQGEEEEEKKKKK